jgi:hypothetical protein
MKNSIEVESRAIPDQGSRGEQNEEFLFNEHTISVLQNERVLEI